MAFTVLHRDEIMTFGHQGPLFVGYFYGVATAAHIALMSDAEAAATAKLGKLSHMSILGNIDLTTKVPDEVNQASKAMLTRLGATMVGGAFAIDTRGIAGVLIRAFFTAFVILARNVFPLRIFADYRAAVRWLQTLPGQNPALAGDAGLVDAVERFVVEATPKKAA